jgi:adhesin/invasin
VAGLTVTFVITGGGGSLTGASAATDAQGIARVGGWTLGGSPGTNTLEARAAGVAGSPVVFTATGTSTGSGVDRLVFLDPPGDVNEEETFTVRVALVDEDGDVVPLDGIFIYIDVFREGRDTPTNTDAGGERFENTDDGVAVFSLRINREGRYRLRALTDDLPELGPHGPEPYLFSDVFEVD